MPTAQAFLDAIIADADDDAPRLAYADWLDERGDVERAEFIRVQLALARMDEGDERRHRFKKRERHLLGNNWQAWLGSVREPFDLPRAAAPATVYRRSFRFERGMLEFVRLPEAKLLEHAEALFRAWPIRDVEVTSCTQQGLAAVAALPWLGRLAHLGMDGEALGSWGDELIGLLRALHPEKLRGLSFHQWQSGAGVVATLAAAGVLGLESLSLTGSVAGDVNALARWEGLSSVTRLSLRGNRLGQADVEALLASPRLGPLVALDLSINQLAPAGARAVAGAGQLAGLRSLRIGSNGFGNGGLEALAASPHLRALRLLDVHDNGCDGAGVQVLAGSPVIDGLNELNLSWNEIRRDGATALADCPRLASLKALYLYSCRLIGPEATEALTASAHLRQVETLSLGSNWPEVAGARAVIESSNLAALRTLYLSLNGFKDDTARALARLPGLARLDHLDLSDNLITDEAARELAASPYGAAVETLYFGSPGKETDSLILSAGMSEVWS